MADEEVLELDYDEDDRASPVSIDMVVSANDESNTKSGADGSMPSSSIAPVFATGINRGRPLRPSEVSHEQADEVRRSLRTNEYIHNLRGIIVKGVDNLNKFQIEKIFADYNPVNTELFDNSTAIVVFATRHDVACMLLGMTKPLKRIRAKKTADEEGEVLDSDDEDEEGQIKREGDDDVAVVDKIEGKSRQSRGDAVVVDVDALDIPDGRWRVVTEHVPQSRFMLVRYVTRDEHKQIRQSIVEDKSVRQASKRPATDDPDDFNWAMGDYKVRPGLNVFDDKGNELDWDYEHDTRFYDDANADEKEKSPVKDVEDAPPLKTGVKVRGRGARLGGGFFGSGDTMRADREDDAPHHSRDRKDSYSREEDVSDWKSNRVNQDESPKKRREAPLGGRLSGW